MTKISITLSGGLVQDIVCDQNDEDVEVIVKDYDIQNYDCPDYDCVKKDKDGEYAETITVFKKNNKKNT